MYLHITCDVDLCDDVPFDLMMSTLVDDTRVVGDLCHSIGILIHKFNEGQEEISEYGVEFMMEDGHVLTHIGDGESRVVWRRGSMDV